MTTKNPSETEGAALPVEEDTAKPTDGLTTDELTQTAGGGVPGSNPGRPTIPK